MTDPATLSPLWVFGYGSLIWKPEFPWDYQEVAVLNGYRRAFCMHSIHHRGTETDPGLVLALDVAEGHHCEGVAFQVAAGAEAKTLADLRERELVSSAYYEDTCEVTLKSGQKVTALCYIVDRDHVQYCADVSLEHQAQTIARAVGGMGPNTEYLWNTAEHLQSLGINDPDLAWLSARVRALT